MKEMGKDLAKEVAKSFLREVSDTISTLLDLEDWAIREIGVGIAKGLIGIDPRKNVIKLRKRAEILCTELESWVSHRVAWNSGRRPPDTLQSCIEEMQELLDAIDKLIEEFKNAVAGFRCVDCDIPEEILSEIAKLRDELNRYMKSFGDLINEIEKRLRQALRLFKRKDVYPKPGYEWMSKSKRLTNEVRRTLRESKEGRKS